MAGCASIAPAPGKERAMTMLDGLTWKPKWVSHLGCLKGCLDYLNVDVSDPWLFGASGHAFVINIHEEVCPSGPTAWHTGRMIELCQNVGCRIDIISAHSSQPDFADKQAEAWRVVRDAIGSGVPCYGWELDIPEFYVIYGCDDAGYYFRGPLCDDGKGPKPWQELGTSEIGWLSVFMVKPAEPKADAAAVKEALEFALDHAGDSSKWTFPKYTTGPASYDTWIAALKEGKAIGFGVAYNAAVWAECRGYAVEFLREAKGSLGADLHPLFDKAVERYAEVARNLKAVAEAFPFVGISEEQMEANIKDEGRRTAAMKALTAARQAEAEGLETLRRIADSL
jgi:hypothetical protein